MTDYSGFYSRFINKIYCTPDAAESVVARRVRERLKRISFTVVRGKEEIPGPDLTMKTLLITAGKGSKVDSCPGSKGHLCCNYLTINLYEGCPIGCTYCIMQSYLNFSPVTVNVDTASIWDEIERVIKLNPGTRIRIGTGEVGDSLFFDPLFELSAGLVERFAGYPNVFFELKTKTDFVDHLLGIPDKGSTVIGWSLNPDEIAETEEGSAASLDKRLAAAHKAVRHGFRLAFHFDPIIRVPGWEDLYKKTAARLEEFPVDRIVWISFGTIRYPKELKNHLPLRPWLFDEFVLCGDGKYRYLQPLREEMYKKMHEFVRNRTDAPVYLCMESPAVWENVFGKIPSKIESLCDIFSVISLKNPNLGEEECNE